MQHAFAFAARAAHALRRALTGCAPTLLLALLLPTLARAQPTVTTLGPATGPLGTSVTLDGTNLTGLTSVRLGAVPAPFTLQSASRATFRVPREAVNQRVRITTGSGTALSTVTFQVTRPSSSDRFPGGTALTTDGSTALNASRYGIPTVTDLDGDGLLDLLVGNNARTVRRFEQTVANGNVFAGGSLLTTDGTTPLDAGQIAAAPTVTDLDGDGLLDLLVGNSNGNVLRFEQTAANGGIFAGGSPLTTDGTTLLDAGQVSVPTVTDLDGDGLLDLLVGNIGGNVLRYEQTVANGSVFAGGTNLTTDGSAALNAGSYVTPTVTDLDGDGLLDLLVGNFSGNVLRYEQTVANGSVFAGGSPLTTDGSAAIDVGFSAAPVLTDVDGDGVLDLLVGNNDGNVLRFEQFLPAPTLTGLNPVSGPAGTPVTIMGTGLDQVQGVRFGTGGLGAVVSRTAGSLVVRVPVDAASGPLTLTPATGSALVSATPFAYTPRPAGLVAVLAPAGPLDVCQPRTLTATAASPAFTTGGGFSSDVHTLAVQADGKALVGGDFAFYQGVTAFRLARLNADGSRDAGFAAGLVGFNGDVNSVAVQADGKLLVGGDFLAYNGIAASNLIRLNPDGSRDASFVTGTGVGASVRSVAVQADGKVLVGGSFTAYNGTAASNLIRLNPDGTPDASFFTSTGFNNTVHTLALQADGKVLVGGEFTTYQGATANRLVRLNADGSRDAFGFNFTTIGGINTTVWTIAVQADGKVLVGGQFALCSFGCRYSLLRLNPNGTEDGNFRIGRGFTLAGNTNAAGTVRSVVVQPDGKVLVGGQFGEYENGTVANNLIRLNNNGTPDTGFTTGTGFNDLVQSVALQADGQVLAGGAFTTYQGTLAGRLARLTPSGSPNSTPTAVSGATFTFAPGGSTTNPLVTSTAGSYTATASLNGETSAASNAVVLTPCATTLTSLNPTSGPVGTNVTLTGTGLTSATGVRFNGTAATTFAVVNATTATATVPAGATTGPVTVTIAGGGTSNGVTFTVTAPIITLSPSALPGGQVGVSYPIIPLSATGGTGPYTFAVTSGTLPTGLTLSAGGVLSGTPTAGGPFPFTVRATDAAGFTGSRAYTMTPAPPSIDVIPNNLANGNVGVAYSQQLQALNGTAPYTFAVTSGALPTGITLTSGGLLAGTPTAGGTFNFTVTATDATTGAGPYTGAQTYSLGIAPAMLTLNPTTLPGGAAGTAYSQTVTASGGISPYTYAVTSGALPTGLTLSAGGVLAGTPTAGGNFVFTITAADASTGVGPSRTSQTYQVIITAPIDLVVSTTTTIAVGTYNSITVNSGGNGTLAGPVTVNSFVTVNNGGTLNTNCQALTGPGSFTLAAGGTLSICAAQGLSSSGSTGSIQVAGSRSFSPDASYVYNGTAAQVTGSGLPATVRTLALSNSAGLTLTGPVTVSTAATLSSGVLSTGANDLTLGPTATLSEDADGYLLGTVQTTRPLNTAGTAQIFGGLGLSLTPSGATLPGSTLVRRTTGMALPGAGTSQSVKRVFDIQPAVKTGLNVALALTVRDDERNGIAPASLRLFKSENNGSTWQPQSAATVATAAASGNQPTTHTARLAGISSFSLWTLGDAGNPLPVELAAFTATASGQRVVRLAWATASEKNSQAFEVERSADGRAFARIGTVAAAGSSSSSARTYELLDAQLPGGAALLYYRLKQVDLDGTFSYSPVRAVSLAHLLNYALTIFPNPTHGGAATLTGAQPGAVVTVTDALGRPVTSATADAAGTATLRLPALRPAGVYVVRSGAQAVRLAVE